MWGELRFAAEVNSAGRSSCAAFSGADQNKLALGVGDPERACPLCYLLPYCGTPSIAITRNVAYLSPIFRASLYSGELYAALASSMLLYLRIVTRVPEGGSSPSIFIGVPAAMN